MKSVRLYFLYATTFFRRKYLQILLILSLILVIIVAFFLFHDYFSPKNVVREGAVGAFNTQDMPETATRLLSQGLLSLDEQGQPKPNLIESITQNETGTEYTIKLKQDLLWGDGSKVIASDIPFSFSDVNVSYLDDQTIQFKLSDSLAPFPTLLTKPIFKRRSQSEQSDEKTNWIGMGPYRLENIHLEQTFIKKLTLKSLDSSLPNVIMIFYPNERSAKTALRLGEVQSLLGVSDTANLTSQKNFNKFSKINYDQIVTIFYNTKDPVLADENLRLALSYSAPSISPEETAITSISPKSWAFNKEVKDYLDNPAQAEVSLKKVNDSKNIQIVLTATTSLQETGQKVIEAWQKQGIKATLKVESGIPQKFQALLIAQNIPSDPDQYSLWHSTQQTNISKYSNPRIDKDLEDGRKATDSAVRKQRYQDFQKVLLDHSPATFLYFPKYNVVYMKKIEVDLLKVLKFQLQSE